MAEFSDRGIIIRLGQNPDRLYIPYLFLEQKCVLFGSVFLYETAFCGRCIPAVFPKGGAGGKVFCFFCPVFFRDFCYIVLKIVFVGKRSSVFAEKSMFVNFCALIFALSTDIF